MKDDQFLERLHSLNRRDEMRSILLIDGVKLMLQRNKQMGRFERYLKNKKKTVKAAWH